MSDLFIITLFNMYNNGDEFSLLVDGLTGGFFKGNRGLREGSCILPILFTLFFDALNEFWSAMVLIPLICLVRNFRF